MSEQGAPQQFISNPVEITAMQFLSTTSAPVSNADAICTWINSNGGNSDVRNGFIWIVTLEGTMRADGGDWIIRGTRGEFYPCKPDVFAVKYRAAASLPESQPREEGVCDDCHRKYPTPWFAANPLWNRVIPDRQGMLCPNCFIWRAQKAGVGTTGWEVREEQLEPESQPSPSGDAADEIVQTLMPSMDREMFLRHTQKVAEIIRSHDAKVGQAWRLIESAPKTGEHILGARFVNDGTGFGRCGGKQQSQFDVIHWWDNPGEEGWYPSNGPDFPMQITHWQPLLELSEVGQAEQRLRRAVKGLLLSADANWYAMNAGHDWREAVDEAEAALQESPSDK